MAFPLNILNIEGVTDKITDCKPTSTVADVKKSYFRFCKIPLGETLELAFRGKVIKDHLKLQEIPCLVKNSTLLALIRCTGGEEEEMGQTDETLLSTVLV